MGGISVNSHDTIVNGTIFDTKNLQLIAGNITGDYDYSIKVMGNSTPVNDSTWNMWFENEEEDVSGKIIVCLMLDCSEVVQIDNNATITIAPEDTEDSLPIQITSMSTYNSKTQSVYLVLNPKHDNIDIIINYTENDTQKDTRYLIDLMDVNSDNNSQG